MLEGYTYRRPFKLHDVNLSVYLKDNQAEAFFSLLDLVRTYKPKGVDCNTKMLEAAAGKENCDTIKTSANYELKVCNATGLAKAMEVLESKDNVDKILASINTFVLTQKTSLPGPVTNVKTIAKISFNGYFSLAYYKKKAVRYLESNGHKWFSVQDIVRLFDVEAAIVEDEISKLFLEDKLEVTLKNGESKLCISGNGLKQIVDALISPDISKEVKDALLRDGGIIKTSLPDNVTNLSVDGENTDILRYAMFHVNDKYNVTVLRYNKNTFVPMYSVVKAAVSLGTNVKAVMAKAERQNIKFVTDGDIFLPIRGLKNILEGVKDYCSYCAGAEAAVRQKDIIDTCLSITSTEGYLALFKSQGNKEKETKIPVDTRHFKPVKTSTDLYVIDYCDINIYNHNVLCCFAKKNVTDRNEKAVPLFWSVHLGYAFDIVDATTIAARKVDDSEKMKASVPELKKHNIRVITMKGVEQMLRAVKKEQEAEKLISAVKEAVNKAYDERKDDIDFMIEKYETRRNATLEEQKQTEEQKEEVVAAEPAATQTVAEEKSDVNVVKDVIAIENFVSYTDSKTGDTHRIEIAGSVDKERGLNVYYNLEQTASVFGIPLTDIDLSDVTVYLGLNGKTLYVTIYGLIKALTNKVSDVTAFVKDLFDQSRTEISGFAKALGVNLKDDLEQKKQHHSKSDSDGSLQELLRDSNNARNYVMGAIVLAERYREALLWLGLHKNSLPSVPGPKDKILLEDLWKFIDCQDPNQTVGFRFQRQVITVSERYQRLRNVIGTLS